MITKNNPKWLDTFINVFSKKEADNAEVEKTAEKVEDQSELSAEAEINVKSLPTVMWNDNKFYVQLDPETKEADVLNEYGNVITTIKNVDSVEAVDEHLNDSKIVAAKCQLSDEELDKVAKMLHIAEEDASQLDEAEKETTAEIIEDTTEDSSDVPVDKDTVVEENETPVETPTEINEVTEVVDEHESEPEFESVKEEVDEVNTNIPNCQCVDCREEAQDDVREVLESTPEPKDATEVLTEHITPEHECGNAECKCVDGICQCAENENAPADGTDTNGTNTDGTDTDETKANASNKVEAMCVSINSLQSKIAGLTEKLAAVEQLYARNNPGNVFDLDSTDTEMQHVEETADAAAEEIALEHTVDISTPEGRCSLKQDILNSVEDILNEVTDEEIIDDVVENTPTEVTEVTVDPIKEVTQVVDDVPAAVPVVEDAVIEVPSIDEPVVETIDENIEVPADDKDTVIVELDEKDSNIFKNQVCPVCGMKSLVLSDSYDDYQGVVCENCGAEFGVNTETEEIFHKE